MEDGAHWCFQWPTSRSCQEKKRWAKDSWQCLQRSITTPRHSAEYYFSLDATYGPGILEARSPVFYLFGDHRAAASLLGCYSNK